MINSTSFFDVVNDQEFDTNVGINPLSYIESAYSLSS